MFLFSSNFGSRSTVSIVSGERSSNEVKLMAFFVIGEKNRGIFFNKRELVAFAGSSLGSTDEVDQSVITQEELLYVGWHGVQHFHTRATLVYTDVESPPSYRF